MNKLLDIIHNNKKSEKIKYSTPPIWIMRQAGRYLPEYREIRANVNKFLDLCYNSKLASEVTLQPIERFDFDAAIIFSDILVIPDALGLKVDFIKNEGPVLQKIIDEKDLQKLDVNKIIPHLQPVFETIRLTKSGLQKIAQKNSNQIDKTLIGFSGSPWTMACYMIEGGSSKNFDSVRKVAIKNPEFFAKLIDILTESVVIYLREQIKAGADVVKLFDSWAGLLPESEFQKWVIEPTKKIVARLREEFAQTPIICFPRGAGVLYKNFVREVKPDVIAVDQNLPKLWIKENLQKEFGVVIQGNLDNQLLAFGSKADIEKEVREIIRIFGDHPFIFNLGHGILPETPIENVELVMKIVRGL